MTNLERKREEKKRGIANRFCKTGSQKGAALIMVLILTSIGLAFTVTLLHMMTTGAQMTGGQKRYDTALQAAKAGVDVIRQVIDAQGDPGVPFPVTMAFSLPALNVSGVDCLDIKLKNSTFKPNGIDPNWGGCNNAVNIDPTDVTSYDMTLNLGVPPNAVYNVYAKIVDTVDGNSGASTGLAKTGVVMTGGGEITVTSLPYLYTVEVLALNSANGNERARLSLLHQF